MKYIWTLAALLLIGCGDAAERTQQTPPAKRATVIEMQLSTPYQVYTGDKVEKSSADAEIAITKPLEGDTTTVELLSGSAQIIRAN